MDQAPGHCAAAATWACLVVAGAIGTGPAGARFGAGTSLAVRTTTSRRIGLRQMSGLSWRWFTYSCRFACAHAGSAHVGAGLAN